MIFAPASPQLLGRVRANNDAPPSALEGIEDFAATEPLKDHARLGLLDRCPLRGCIELPAPVLSNGRRGSSGAAHLSLHPLVFVFLFGSWR